MLKLKYFVIFISLIFLLSITSIFSCPVAKCGGDGCQGYSYDPEQGICVPKVDTDGDGIPDTELTWNPKKGGICSSGCDYCPCSSDDITNLESMIGDSIVFDLMFGAYDVNNDGVIDEDEKKIADLLLVQSFQDAEDAEGLEDFMEDVLGTTLEKWLQDLAVDMCGDLAECGNNWETMDPALQEFYNDYFSDMKNVYMHFLLEIFGEKFFTADGPMPISDFCLVAQCDPANFVSVYFDWMGEKGTTFILPKIELDFSLFDVRDFLRKSENIEDVTDIPDKTFFSCEECTSMGGTWCSKNWLCFDPGFCTYSSVIGNQCCYDYECNCEIIEGEQHITKICDTCTKCSTCSPFVETCNKDAGRCYVDGYQCCMEYQIYDDEGKLKTDYFCPFPCSQTPDLECQSGKACYKSLGNKCIYSVCPPNGKCIVVGESECSSSYTKVSKCPSNSAATDIELEWCGYRIYYPETKKCCLSGKQCCESSNKCGKKIWKTWDECHECVSGCDCTPSVGGMGSCPPRIIELREGCFCEEEKCKGGGLTIDENKKCCYTLEYSECSTKTTECSGDQVLTACDPECDSCSKTVTSCPEGKQLKSCTTCTSCSTETTECPEGEQLKTCQSSKYEDVIIEREDTITEYGEDGQLQEDPLKPYLNKACTDIEECPSGYIEESCALNKFEEIFNKKRSCSDITLIRHDIKSNSDCEELYGENYYYKEIDLQGELTSCTYMGATCAGGTCVSDIEQCGLLATCGNGICDIEENETQTNCPVDCYTTVNMIPDTGLEPNQLVDVEVDFEDSRFDLSKKVSFYLILDPGTSDEMIWENCFHEVVFETSEYGTHACSCSGMDCTCDKSQGQGEGETEKWKHVTDTNIITEHGKFTIKTKCNLPSTIEDGDHVLKAIPYLHGSLIKLNSNIQKFEIKSSYNIKGTFIMGLILLV